MRYIEFLDIKTPFSGALGKIEFDPFLAAVASLKTTTGETLVSHWIDPLPALSIIEAGSLKLRDASSSGVMQTIPGASILQKTNAINKQPTFTATSASGLNQGTSADVRADEWSMLAVVDVPATTGRYDIFGIGSGAVGSGNLFPGLEVSVDSGGTQMIISREGGTSERRIVRSFVGIAGVPAIVAVTFSIDLGFSVFKNNMEGFFRNASDKRALTIPTFSYLSNRLNANPAIGNFGMGLILRADLSKPEYKESANIILGGLKTKYNIL